MGSARKSGDVLHNGRLMGRPALQPQQNMRFSFKKFVHIWGLFVKKTHVSAYRCGIIRVEVIIMRRGLALATFIVGIISILCGITATTLGAVGLRKNRDK